MSSSLPSLILSKKIQGKYINIDVYTSKIDGRKFIQGVIKCPFTNKEFTFTLVPQLDQIKLGIIQCDGGFLEHCRKIDKYKEWFYERIDSYSRNSFHKRKYFVCTKCQFKTNRYIDILIHLITTHKFLVEVP